MPVEKGTLYETFAMKKTQYIIQLIWYKDI